MLIILLKSVISSVELAVVVLIIAEYSVIPLVLYVILQVNVLPVLLVKF